MKAPAFPSPSGERHPSSERHPAERCLAEQALRVYRRYAYELVEAFSICPYARRSRQQGQVRELVLTDPAPELSSLLEHIEAMASDETIEIGLLLLPRSTLDARALEHCVQALRRLHQQGPQGLVMALEGFHPRAEVDASAPRRLIPFLRRTPDPTIQLARRTTLERLREGRPTGTSLIDLDAFEALLGSSNEEMIASLEPSLLPLHERVAETNWQTFCSESGESIAALLEAIHDDRDRSYASIDGLEPPPPRWRV